MQWGVFISATQLRKCASKLLLSRYFRGELKQKVCGRPLCYSVEFMIGHSDRFFVAMRALCDTGGTLEEQFSTQHSHWPHHYSTGLEASRLLLEADP